MLVLTVLSLTYRRAGLDRTTNLLRCVPGETLMISDITVTLSLLINASGGLEICLGVITSATPNV